MKMKVFPLKFITPLKYSHAPHMKVPTITLLRAPD